MTFPRYLEYVNESGKITPRSTLECLMALGEVVEYQEKIIARHEENFKEIEDILTKLASKRDIVTKPTVETLSGVSAHNDTETTTQASIESPSQPTCPECKKTFKNELGLNGHMKTHAK